MAKKEDTLLIDKTLEKVIAIDGKEYNKEDCRKIKGEYWKIGDTKVKDSGHCYYINERYYCS